MALIQRPEALGLVLCDKVAFEQGTQKPYLLGIFTGIAVDGFPSSPLPFDVFAALTDGLGRGRIDLVVTEMGSDAEVGRQVANLNFPDPLRVINVRFRFRQLSFPTGGTYLFELRTGGEVIAHRRVLVHEGED